MQHEHWQFFKEQDRSFGVFYPLHYIVAAFDTPERADYVRKEFVEAGFGDDEVASATGPFVTRTLESTKGATWLERFKIGFASFLGTELGYVDDDRKLAERGAGFLFVHAPDASTIERAEKLLVRAHPISARRYDHAGIRRLVYPPQAAL
ncbi:MAG TPA: hypothetical protein VHE32_10930 [Rhodanobacteraceae bacterium]|nr:hypothetical protein [Rhodanobacteraceae bacterium]